MICDLAVARAEDRGHNARGGHIVRIVNPVCMARRWVLAPWLIEALFVCTPPSPAACAFRSSHCDAGAARRRTSTSSSRQAPCSSCGAPQAPRRSVRRTRSNIGMTVLCGRLMEAVHLVILPRRAAPAPAPDHVRAVGLPQGLRPALRRGARPPLPDGCGCGKLGRNGSALEPRGPRPHRWAATSGLGRSHSRPQRCGLRFEASERALFCPPPPTPALLLLIQPSSNPHPTLIQPSFNPRLFTPRLLAPASSPTPAFVLLLR